MAGGASFLVTNAHLIRPFACELCERVYTRQEHLDRHVSAKHTGEKDHLCLTCGKRFSRRDILRRHEQAHVKAKNIELANIANGTVPVKKTTKAAPKKPAKRRASPKQSVTALNRAVRTSKACDRCSRSKLRCDADGEDNTSEVACARCLRAGFQCLYTRAASTRKRNPSSRSNSSATLTRDNSGESDEEVVEGHSDDDYFEPGEQQEEDEDEEEDERPGPAHIYRQNQNQQPLDRRPAPYMAPHPYYNPLDASWQRPPDNFYSNTNAGFSNTPRQAPLPHQHSVLPHQQGSMLPHQYYPVPFPTNFQYPAFPAPTNFASTNTNPYAPSHHPYTDTSDSQDVAAIAQSLSGLAERTAMKSNIDWSVLQRNPFTPDLNLTLSPAEGESALPPTDSTALDHRRDSVGSSVNGTRSNVYMNSAAESLLSLARF